MITLSILTPTTPERSEMFESLFKKVKQQINNVHTIHPTLGSVQHLFDDSIRFIDGGLSIGFKRQNLLDMACGEYLCYLDSDEDVSPDYVETLLRLCYEKKDVGTFRSLSKLSNSWALVDMRLNNPTQQINPDGITLRNAWHVCPVRSDYAKKFKFSNSNYGEDWTWFEQVLTLCKTEAHTDRIIHQYTHGAHSEADKIK